MPNVNEYQYIQVQQKYEALHVLCTEILMKSFHCVTNDVIYSTWHSITVRPKQATLFGFISFYFFAVFNHGVDLL